MAVDFSQAEVDIAWRLLNLAAIDTPGRAAHLRAASYAATAARRHLSLIPDISQPATRLVAAINVLLAEIRSQEQIHRSSEL
jgi:hypothetical protein